MKVTGDFEEWNISLARPGTCIICAQNNGLCPGSVDVFRAVFEIMDYQLSQKSVVLVCANLFECGS